LAPKSATDTAACVNCAVMSKAAISHFWQMEINSDEKSL
jgi:hypothetical protein